MFGKISTPRIEDLALVAIIILVGLAAFGLGRLSVKQAPVEPFDITAPDTSANGQ